MDMSVCHGTRTLTFLIEDCILIVLFLSKLGEFYFPLVKEVYVLIQN